MTFPIYENFIDTKIVVCNKCKEIKECHSTPIGYLCDECFKKQFEENMNES